MTRHGLALALAIALLLSACDQHTLDSTDVVEREALDVELRVLPLAPLSKKASASSENDRAAAVQAYLAQVNADLAAQGLNIAVQQAEWVGGGDSHEAGQTVYANDRTLRLSSQWVPDDSRRNADGDNITQVVDQSFAFANASINSEPAIDASFDTWNEVSCSKLDIVKLSDAGGLNYSAILTVTGPGGVEPVDVFYADISTVGFLPGALFEAVLGPGASESVLGVTFTFIWIDGDGNPTDINSDGYADVALKEVWYNDAFAWSTDGSGIDIETVALHENGHALGLGHFGRVFVTEKNNKLHVSPRAVMNAFILGTLRDPLGTDNGSYCGLYAAWP